MLNTKILKIISMAVIVIFISVMSNDTAGAVMDHIEQKACNIKTIVPDNLINEGVEDGGKTETIDETEADGDSEPEADEKKLSFTSEEKKLFARLVHAEAKGEPYIGKVAVAAAVLNRIESSEYPDDLKSVIFEVNSGYYQFSPVRDGSIWQAPDDSAYLAVEEAMEGADPSGGAISFYNPRKTGNQWVRRQPVTTVIGNHVFFRLP